MGQVRPSIAKGVPLTLAEYAALDLDRPLTDGPIGSTTDARRGASAAASAVFTDTETHMPAGWKKPPGDPEWTDQRIRGGERR